jgi:cytochrome d ubiquinol oxidase subunit I
VQIFIGDAHGLNTLEYQPAKVAAMEGHYTSHPTRAPLYLFGIPDDENQRLNYAIGIPGLSSLILKHGLEEPLDGLDKFAAEDRPPVAMVFFAFRIMVGIGLAMVAVAIWAAVARWRGRLYTSPWLHRACLAMGPSGIVAVLAGWIVTEVGRQPYTIYGLLRTADSAAPLVAETVGNSLLFFIVVYFAVFGAGVFYILRLMSRPPVYEEPTLGDVVSGPIRTAGITPAQEEIVRRRRDGEFKV